MPIVLDKSRTVYRVSVLNPDISYPISPVQENVVYRASLIKQAEKDLNYAEALFKLCAEDIVFWIDNFAWTKDTRIDPPINPFICYDFQIPLILRAQRHIKDGLGDLGIEKTRDMGVSWAVLYVFQHFFQFSEGSDFRVGSRKEEFVDKIGVIDTLLEKVRFNLERQPAFLMPRGFDTIREFRDATTYMKLVNKANNNAIIGESANEHFGSGGRSRAILLDEFAKWPTGVDEQAWTSTADVTRCRIPVSTPVGSANKFARLMRGSREKIDKETLHWTLHPEKVKGCYYLSDGIKIPIDLSKDHTAAYKMWIKMGRPSKVIRSDWYDVEALRRTDADLAQEVDIDYHRSGSMFFNSAALGDQNIWQFMTRTNPEAAIPYGKFIRARITEVNDKVRILETHDGWLKIFELPKAEHQYTLGADTAEGLMKGDQSAGVIVDKTNNNVVAAWNYLTPPEDFAKDIQLAAWLYNEADVAAENNNHGYCFDKETEVLTDKGWKLFKDLDKTEKVATLNIGKDTIEYQKPSQYTKIYEKSMCLGQQGHADFCVSEDHTMLFYDRSRLKPKLCRAMLKDVPYTELILKHSALWNGVEEKSIKIGCYDIRMDFWMEFLGIFLADGNVRAKKKHNGRQYYFMSIAQSKSYPDKIDKIRELLKKMPFHSWEYEQKQVVNGKVYNSLIIFKITDKGIWEHLISHTGIGAAKKAPDYVGSLSSRQISLFLEYFFMGDGHERRDNERTYFPGLSKVLADQLQEYLLKIGKIATVKTDLRPNRKPNYFVSEYKYPNARTYLRKSKILKMVYEDYAYCVSVKNETLLVRRNGRPIFLGNTTCKELSEMSHVKLYNTRKDETKEGEQVTPKRGWSTTNKSRPEMLNYLAHLVDKVSMELRDFDLISQCETFIRNGDKGGRPEADGTFLDDMIIACAIAVKVTDEIPFSVRASKITGEQREALEKRLHTRNAGFGFKR